MCICHFYVNMCEQFWKLLMGRGRSILWLILEKASLPVGGNVIGGEGGYAEGSGKREEAGERASII